MQNTLDATVVFPTEALGTRYIVQDYPSTDNHGGEVGFVATEDNTVLSMTVPCGIQGTSITAGTTLSVTLNQGQAYMLLAARGGSLSGMEVTSNGKPFAMFHGDWNIAVPQYVNARDHCYEQALPVDRWGTEFIFGSIPPQSSVNHVRITASENNTLITREGASNIGPLQQRQTWQGSMSYGEIWHLTATKPIQVILYMGSMDYTNVGDPSSVTIPPLTHAICDSRFNCDRTDSIRTETHYLSIVCHEDYDSGLTLDEQPIGTRGTVTPVGNYRYRTVQVPHAERSPPLETTATALCRCPILLPTKVFTTCRTTWVLLSPMPTDTVPPRERVTHSHSAFHSTASLPGSTVTLSPSTTASARGTPTTATASASVRT